MLNEIFQDIKIEIESLPDVLSAEVDITSNHDDIEKKEFKRQQRFLNDEIKKIQTNYIFIDMDDVKATVKLKSNKNSSAFTKLKEAITRIIDRHTHKYNATHDKLTGIYNRFGLETALKDNSNFKSITYCISDIDNFKQINDTYSHEHGDEVLIQVAKRLSEKCKELTDENSKYIFARLGGEEFVIAILSEHPQLETPEKIRKSLSGSTSKTSFTSSLGFTYSELKNPLKIEQTTILYRQSDTALYKSKKEGKDRSTDFFHIKKYLGKILEIDRKNNIIAIDIGSNAGVKEQDIFTVYPEKYSGGVKFIVDDGRSKKPIGEYPKISAGHIYAQYVQEEISFCHPYFSPEAEFEIGSRLNLTDRDEVF